MKLNKVTYRFEIETRDGRYDFGGEETVFFDYKFGISAIIHMLRQYYFMGLDNFDVCRIYLIKHEIVEFVEKEKADE